MVDFVGFVGFQFFDDLELFKLRTITFAIAIAIDYYLQLLKLYVYHIALIENAISLSLKSDLSLGLAPNCGYSFDFDSTISQMVCLEPKHHRCR